ncbi:hypothetical protein [Longispora urticae]
MTGLDRKLRRGQVVGVMCHPVGGGRLIGDWLPKGDLLIVRDEHGRWLASLSGKHLVPIGHLVAGEHYAHALPTHDGGIFALEPGARYAVGYTGTEASLWRM